jgi:phage FluMu protein Com
MPVPSTSVKWMHGAMQGAPVLDNNWGDLTALLRACAVNGFNVKPIQAITCNGTTATVQCSGHGYLEHQVVKIEGAEPAGYNGEHRIVSVVDANTVTITLAAALAPASTASGQTLQMRAALFVRLSIKCPRCRVINEFTTESARECPSNQKGTHHDASNHQNRPVHRPARQLPAGPGIPAGKL